MPRILISPLSGLEDAILRHRPSHIVTLLSPEHMIATPEGFDSDRHLKLGVNDITNPVDGTAPPARMHIERLIAFSRSWPAESPLLIHCWAGVSRSMAAAYTVLCDRAKPGREEHIALALRGKAPYAWPNALMVRHADDILRRDGRMIAAVQALGVGVIVTEGVCTEISLDEI